MYGTGRGVARDDAEAVRWYRRAAEQGHTLGQTNLGVRYRDGRGVSQDHGEAVRWFRRAAEQGHAGGQGEPRLDVRERSGRATGSRGSRPLVSSCSRSRRFVGAGAARSSSVNRAMGSVAMMRDVSRAGVGAAQYGQRIAAPSQMSVFTSSPGDPRPRLGRHRRRRTSGMAGCA